MGTYPAGAALLASVRQLATRAKSDPLTWVRWTPPQVALLKCTDPRVLLRTGNQFGKTWAGLAETVFRCLGEHPYKRVQPPPIEAWIITAGWGQSLAVQAKLWDLLPKAAITSDTIFDPVRGFRGGQQPVIKFRNGSLIRVKTSRQGGLSLSGATIHFVLGDEPFSSQRVYSEIERRLTRTGGALFLTMTPVNGPVDYLKELVEAGNLTDLHYEMKPENFVPVGSVEPLKTEDGVPMDAAWIEVQEKRVLSWEAPVILHGSWEPKFTGAAFENFHRAKHVIPDLLSSDVGPQGEVDLLVGIDYGEDKLRTVGLLVAIDPEGEYPKVYILGEYAPDRPSTVDMDGKGILRMLARRGFKWSQLTAAHGDKRYTDARGKLTIKSNARMLEAMEKALKTSRGLRPKIQGAKRGRGQRGAVWAGVRWINDCMIREGHFYIDASCEWTIKSLERWDGDSRSKYKDACDSARYALKPWILPQTRRKAQRVYRSF